MLTKQDQIKDTMRGMTQEDIDIAAENLKYMEPWLAHENFNLTTHELAVMTMQLKEKLEEMLDILKIDRTDPNIKDTAMRIASMYINEWMVGRYDSKPRIEAFPNPNRSEEIIIKKCKVQSLCGHHLAPFFSVATDPNSFCVVAYKPTKEYLGISKISRLVDWYARRPQLQENLCNQIMRDLQEVLESPDVLVYMKNIVHTCEYTRGSEDQEASTTTMVYDGVFKDVDTRRSVIASI